MKQIWLVFFLIVTVFPILAMDHLNELNLILFDVSKSMEGYGDGQGIDVFQQEKDAAIFLVEHVPNNSYLMVMPFHDNIEKNLFKGRIEGDAQRIQAADFIHYLETSGNQTSLTKSVQSAIAAGDLAITMERFIPEYGNLYIFSDGKGNDELDHNIDNLIKAITIDDPLMPAMNTQIIAIGKVFSEEELKKLAEANAHVISFDREQFQQINIYVTSLGAYSMGTVIYQLMKLETNRDMIGTEIDLGVVVQEFEEIVLPIVLERSVEVNTKKLLENKSFHFPDRPDSVTVFKSIRRRFEVIDSLYGVNVASVLDTVDAARILNCFTALDSLIKEDLALNLRPLRNLANYKDVGLDTLFVKPAHIRITNETIIDTISFNVAQYRSMVDSLYGVDLQKLGLSELHTSLNFSVDVRQLEDGSTMFPSNQLLYTASISRQTFEPMQEILGKKKSKGIRFEVEASFKTYAIYIGVLLGVAVLVVFMYLWSRSVRMGTTRDYKYVDVSGYLSGNTELLDLSKMLEDILKKEKHLLNNIRIQKPLTHNKIAQINAQRDAVFYVLNEIIINAAEAASATDGSRIAIKVGEDMSAVKMMIQDNGIGVPGDMRVSVFRKKFSTKGREGAGLIKCHKIMHALHGEITYRPITRLETDAVTRSHKVIDDGTIITLSFPRNGRG